MKWIKNFSFECRWRFHIQIVWCETLSTPGIWPFVMANDSDHSGSHESYTWKLTDPPINKNATKFKESVSKTRHWARLIFSRNNKKKKKLRDRMITRICALETSELGASSRYPKHSSPTSGKFSRNLSSKNVRQKLTKLHIKLQNLELNIDRISQKSPFCYFSCNKKRLCGRMVTKVDACERSDVGLPLV